jgi:hypothetical protein
MKKHNAELCNYWGSFIGMIGTVYSAATLFAIDASDSNFDFSCIFEFRKQYNPCSTSLIELNTHAARFGLILIGLGFFVQLFPGLLLFKKWVIVKLQKSKGLKLD